MATAKKYIDGAALKIKIKNAREDLDSTTTARLIELLNDMLSAWNGEGIHLPYIIPSSADDEMGLPAFANECIESQLAVRAAPEFGKVLAPEVSGLAQASFVRLKERLYSDWIHVSYPSGLPLGAGNRSTSGVGRRFYADERRNNVYSDSNQTLINEENLPLEAE